MEKFTRLEGAAARSGVGEADFPAELLCQAPADRQPHSETPTAVSLMVTHLIELVEQVGHVLRGHPLSRVPDA